MHGSYCVKGVYLGRKGRYHFQKPLVKEYICTMKCIIKLYPEMFVAGSGAGQVQRAKTENYRDGQVFMGDAELLWVMMQ